MWRPGLPGAIKLTPVIFVPYHWLSGQRRTAITSTVTFVVGVALYRAVPAYRQGRLLLATVIVGTAGLVFSPVSWTHHQLWLVLAALVAVSTRPGVAAAWVAAVLAVMILPVTSIGGRLGDEIVLGHARLWLAVALATLISVIRRPVTGAADGRSTSAGNLP